LNGNRALGYLVEEMYAVPAVQWARHATTTESRPVENQPVISDERCVVAHGSVHASTDRCRTDLDDVGGASHELETRVAGAALVHLLVGDEIAVCEDDLEADDGVRAP